MLLNVYLSSCRKTLSVTRILLVIWTPVLRLWDQGMYGKFSYLWTTARVSAEREMGCGCNQPLIAVCVSLGHTFSFRVDGCAVK